MRVTRTSCRLHVQPDRHDEVAEDGALVARLDQARPQRADQLQGQLLRLGALEPLTEELRVEADLELLTGERDGQRLARLADVRRLRRDVQRALGEAQAKRR